MCRLVTESEDVAPFIPMLLPALKRAADETADLEAAGEAKNAVDALTKALGVGVAAERAKAGLAGETPWGDGGTNNLFTSLYTCARRLPRTSKLKLLPGIEGTRMLIVEPVRSDLFVIASSSEQWGSRRRLSTL